MFTDNLLRVFPFPIIESKSLYLSKIAIFVDLIIIIGFWPELDGLILAAGEFPSKLAIFL